MPETSGAATRERIVTSLRRPSRNQLVVGVLLAVLGFAMVTQVHQTRTDDTYAGLRSADLVQVLTGLNAQAQRSSSELDALRRTRGQLLSSSQRRQAAVRQAQQEVADLGILAGTTPAVGPGLSVTVRDDNAQSALNNLLEAVQELRDAGAEAIEINGSVRVVAQTWFDIGRTGVLVDGTEVGSPYVLEAIGNPDTLTKGLQFAGGFVDKVHADSGQVSIARHPRVEIKAVVASRPPRYAQTPSGQ